MRRLVGVTAAAALTVLGAAPVQAAAARVPPLAWSPTTTPGGYAFGTVDAGAGATRPVTFTLTASGDSSGAVKKVTVSGSAAFTITASTCTGISLGPGKSCTVTVQYAPATAGENDSATLTALTTQATASLSLSGTSGTPDLAWSPSPYDFGTVNATDTPAQAFTLTNSGTGTSATLTAALSGASDFSATADACTGTVLGPGQSCAVTVQYAPTASQNDTATLSAGGVSVAITGTGNAPLQITGIDANDGGGGVGDVVPFNLDGQTAAVVEGGVDQTFEAQLANIPAGGVTYHWQVTTPNSGDFLVNPDQSTPSLLVPASSIPNFVPQLITGMLTVTPNNGSAPVTASFKILYRDSALSIAAATACSGLPPTPIASASTIPSNGSLTITQNLPNPTGCLPLVTGAVTYSQGGTVLETTTSPTDPVVLQGSTLGVGNDTITVTYDIWRRVAFAPYSVNVPVTVTP